MVMTMGVVMTVVGVMRTMVCGHDDGGYDEDVGVW